MKKNMGNIDRVIRVILGAAIVIAGLLYGSWWGLVGVVLLGTALIRWCPLYFPFNINTGAKQP